MNLWVDGNVHALGETQKTLTDKEGGRYGLWY